MNRELISWKDLFSKDCLEKSGTPPHLIAFIAKTTSGYNREYILYKKAVQKKLPKGFPLTLVTCRL